MANSFPVAIGCVSLHRWRATPTRRSPGWSVARSSSTSDTADGRQLGQSRFVPADRERSCHGDAHDASATGAPPSSGASGAMEAACQRCLQRCPDAIAEGRAGTAGDEFEPGWIYELIYEAQDPLVMGVGFRCGARSDRRVEGWPAGPIIRSSGRGNRGSHELTASVSPNRDGFSASFCTRASMRMSRGAGSSTD
jgi:hypothetical protein